MTNTTFQEDDGISYLFLDWGELGALTTALASKILAEDRAPYDRLIALATGGHTMSKAMKDYLKIPRVSSLDISFYTGIATTDKTPVIKQSIGTDLQGERVLVFDDVNDSGQTLKVAAEYLSMRGVKSIDSATLLQKPTTHSPSTYFGQETTSWIIFPDEVRETIVELTARWQKQGLAKSAINTRLREIGFADAHIELIETYS